MDMKSVTVADVLKHRKKCMISLITRELNKSVSDAMQLLYSSRTYKELVDNPELSYVSTARCFEELQMEMNNDPFWMLCPFE